MKKNIMKIREGSALIVAILVMAVLLTLTLGLSYLTVSEIRQTGDIVAAGKAYYAAEAGVENALLDLHEHLPGFQTKNVAGADDQGWIKQDIPDPANLTGENLSYEYRILNQGDKYPYFDDNKPYFLTPDNAVPKQVLYEQHPEDTYDILPLNETVTIPLFVDCGDGRRYKDVKNFVLEYYVDFQTEDMEIAGFKLGLGTKLHDFDILRWKLFGTPIDDPMKTHAISDFYPANENDGPTQPVCIGSAINLATECLLPAAVPNAETVDLPTNIPDWSKVKVTPDNTLGDIWSLARECYTSDAGAHVAPSTSGIQKGCTIQSFMQSHNKNYLTITNVVNPDIIGLSTPEKRAAKANIYYRVIAEGDPGQVCPGENNPSASDVMVREYAEINANGYASDRQVKQSIDASLKLNSFLPVFNFTIFRTDPDKVNPEDQVAIPFAPSSALPAQMFRLPQ